MRPGKKPDGEFNDKMNDGENRRENDEEDGVEDLMTCSLLVRGSEAEIEAGTNTEQRIAGAEQNRRK